MSDDTGKAPGRRPIAARRGRWRLALTAAIATSAVGFGLWYERGRRREESAHHTAETRPVAADQQVVEVATPRKGGIAHTTVQPGSIHAFEFAEIFAKVSGYLKEQAVDIGDRVKAGQVLAEIDDPEVVKAAAQAKAELEQSKAQVRQAEAKVQTSESKAKAAEAQVAQARVEVEKFRAALDFRTKQRQRITELANSRAVDQRLVDEQEDQYQSALAAVHQAEASVLTAEAQLGAARADIAQAKADLAEAQARVELTQAALEKAKVFVDYMKIISPYDGVVTARNFHRGAFIRSAAEGNIVPLLRVARTDKVRVLVQIPDRDVPFADRGDPASLRVDALRGKEFRGTISRLSESENPLDRTMRVEVDLENTEGRLREGMYGYVTITLQPPARALTVPSNSLLQISGDGEGYVYVVKAGKARRIAVRVGKDNGLETEILGGLTADESVIVHPGTLSDGMPVTVSPPATGPAHPAGHQAHARVGQAGDVAKG